MGHSGSFAEEVAAHFVVGWIGIGDWTKEFFIHLVPAVVPVGLPVDVDIPNDFQVCHHDGHIHQHIVGWQVQGRFDATHEEQTEEKDAATHGGAYGSGHPAQQADGVMFVMRHLPPPFCFLR